nr:thiol protease/hemagglutinin PrtT [uncultured Draconibacterium sp.]
MNQKFLNTLILSSLLCLLIFPQQVSAKEVDLQKAQQVAINIFSKESGISKKTISIKEVIPFEHDGILVFRIINFNPIGYILVSAEDNVEPVLGYGLTSNFDIKSIPPALNFLLGEYKREIKFIKEKKLSADEKLKSKWDSYSAKNYAPTKSYSTGTFLLETEWGQGDRNAVISTDYNKFCPEDPNTGRKCLAGCSAVALAQILHYWQCRVFPDKTRSYTPSGFSSSLTVDFYDQNYNWDAMDHESPDLDNAKLIFHCGVAIGVNYTDSSTWIPHSQNYKVSNAMTTYFGFQTSGRKYKSSYGESIWINMLKSDIDAGRPIYYAGADDSENIAHAWVIDGYRADNTFHCNWGWTNSHEENDFYLLSQLNPSNDYSFTTSQQAILGAEPIIDACLGLEGSDMVCSSNQAYSVSIPSTASIVWSMSKNLNQIGGNTSTTYTVNSRSSGAGFVTATIKNSRGQTFLNRTKDLWVGTEEATVFSPFDLNQNAYNWYLTTGTPFEFRTSLQHPSNDPADYIWTVWDQQQQIMTMCPPGTGGYFIASHEGYYTVNLQFNNDCGWGDVKSQDFYFIKSSSLLLQMNPNPTNGETAVSIDHDITGQVSIKSTSTETIFDENAEWDLEVYDNVQSLKLKKQKLKGKSTTINTHSWKEGVYMVRIKYKDEILTGKLVVKK